jgi:hypothetical protein
MRQLFTPFVLVAALLSGCATVSVDRAKDLSTAGIAYSKATAAVIDMGINASIDASSERRVLAAPRPPVSPDEQAQRERDLKAADAELIKSTTKYTWLKRSVNGIEAYFTALQQLANGSTAEATETAVKGLADRLNGINTALDKTDKGQPRISEEQKTAIAGLAKLVTTQVHGAILAKALERDAPIIGRALVLQQIVLNDAASDVRAALNEANERFYTRRVLRPYKSGEIDADWVVDRRTYVKVKAIGDAIEAVSAAEAAARQMQTVWARILSGEYSAKELTAMLKDTEDLLTAATALKEANAKK